MFRQAQQLARDHPAAAEGPVDRVIRLDQNCHVEMPAQQAMEYAARPPGM
jgi:hypothetical protein